MIPLEDSLPPAIRKVLQVLMAAGYEAYLVGGCVRDWLRGAPVHDYDVATNAHPKTVVQLFEHTIPTGLKHGTVTVLLDGMATEVTTYRKDLGYSDGRRPDGVNFNATLLEDLARRDFTINAMAVGVSGKLIDPFDGRRDLMEGRIRAVGEPSVRFAEDGLRIFRAIRFAATLEFVIEPNTLKAMETHAHHLSSIATERLGQEILRIAGGSWWSVANLLSEGPWLSVLPSPWPTLRQGVAPFSESLTRTENAARLFHRLGAEGEMEPWQLQCCSMALWCKLAHLESDQVRRWLLQMAFDKPRRYLVREVHRCMQQDPALWTEFEWRVALFESGRLPVYLASVLLDGLEPADAACEKGASTSRELQCEQFVQTQPLWSVQGLAVSGLDLQVLGAAGSLIGQVLRHLVAAVLAMRVKNTKEALLLEAKQKLVELKS